MKIGAGGIRHLVNRRYVRTLLFLKDIMLECIMSTGSYSLLAGCAIHCQLTPHLFCELLQVPEGQLEKKERKQRKKAREQEAWVGVGRRVGNV